LEEEGMTQRAGTSPSTYEDLRDAVAANQGLLAISMEQLRDIHGAGRLGVHVRDAISGSLQRYGLGHFPEELPAYQEQDVRIYQLGTPLADLVHAVLDPKPARDEILRQAAGQSGQDLIRKIRELVCE
jgi:hypothetical protein